jgi:hypothetical protein
MKNIESPSPEKFILTAKKKRMIKALMEEFICSNLYLLHEYKGCFVPELIDYENFLKQRLTFLAKINFTIAIEVVNTKVWTGLIFQYKEEKIFVQTYYRKKYI